MTLSLALNNALSGLTATSTQAETISANVSNALNDGYGRREVALSSSDNGRTGGGVRVDGLSRAESPFLSEARRYATAERGASEALSDAARRLAEATGEPGAPKALATEADRLDAALAAVADTPESQPLLTAAVASAGDFAASINRIATEAMALRTEADQSIARQVAQINSTLTKLQSLNTEIRARTLSGGDASALEDQRDRLIKDISSMIPVRVVKRGDGEVALFARGGGQLLDGAAFELGFTPTTVVTPDKTLADGTLSGLTIEGKPVRIGEGGGLYDGGSLSAAFEVRDRLVPAAAAELDGVAADLIQRTEGLAEDATVAPGSPGLFTDDGAAFSAGAMVGLSLRLAVNAAVDPTRGGDAWRLRDGLGAAVEGDRGESILLRAIQDALTENRAAPAGAAFAGSDGVAGFAADFGAARLSDAAAREDETIFRLGRFDALSDAERAETGVDSDQELSRLLAVEAAYAANARVVQAVDEMLERLTSL